MSLRAAARPAALLFCVLATAYCGEQGKFTTGTGGNGGGGGDTQAPVSKVLFPGGAADTVVDITDSLKFTARSTDDNRVATMTVRVHGLGAFNSLDTTVMDTTTSAAVLLVQKDYSIPLPPTATGQHVAIVISSSDAAGNGGGDSQTVYIDDPTPPDLLVRSPTSTVTVPSGGQLPVILRATDPSGIRRMGARLFTRNALGQPIAITGDSQAYATRVTVKVDTFLVPIPAAMKPGNYTVQGFAVDSSINANVATSSDLNIIVADTAAPFGNFAPAFNGSQKVAGDSILVGFRARDLTGVSSFTLRGYSKRGSVALGTDTTVARYALKTVTLPAFPTDTTILRYLNAVLTDSTAEKVYLEAVITDQSGNKTTVLDSVNVVAGAFVSIGSPLAGTRIPVGVPVSVSITGRAPDTLSFLGFTATGVIADAESVAVAGNQVNATQIVVLNSLASTPNGAETIVPFAVSHGKRITGPSLAVLYADTIKPIVTMISPAAGLPITVGDSVLVRFRLQDNRGVTGVALAGIAHRGIDSLGTGHDVVRYALKTVAMPTGPTDTTFSRYLNIVPGDSTVEFVRILVSAQDSSGNVTVDTTQIQIVGGPHVLITRPTAGASTAPGKSVVVQVDASKVSAGILVVGFATSGVYASRDSIVLAPAAGALPGSYSFIKTFTIPVGTPNGTLTFTPFALDSLRNISGVVPGVDINVSSAVVVAVPPAITYTVGRRVETADSITIEATSPAGIGRIGFRTTLLSNGSAVSADSSDVHFAVPVSGGTTTDFTEKFSLNMPITSFPAEVVVQPFAYDSGMGVAGYALATPETLTVVAGKTFSLPAGSQISDAIYNRNRNELYMANTPYDRIDIFSLTSNTFVGYIPVGSRPTSLALWPRDSAGNYSDTLIVANSGGTNLSVVDVTGARRELWRDNVPDYIVSTVKTQTNSGGGLDLVHTYYGFSDRPFQIGAMCVTAGTAKCHHVRVLYSTTPTPGQTSPFGAPAQGYLAWMEMDSANTRHLPAHLIYEHAAVASGGSVDTLEILAVRDSMPGQSIIDTIVGIGDGVPVTITALPFQDSTLVRNSGDALHAIVGEGGGAITLARVLTYDVRPAVTTNPGSCTLLGFGITCNGQRDNGVTAVDKVSDFVTNRSSRVSSVAINYNGRTNLVRADSIYAFDWILKQTGLMQISQANGAVGMDMHPCNNFDADTRTATATAACGGGYSPSNRMVFAARPDSTIDVFDTYFYGTVTDTTITHSTIPIPIRNALIGPVRIAATGSATLMFGFTAYGLVVVNLPTVNNSLFPTRRPAVTATTPNVGRLAPTPVLTSGRP